MTTFTNPPKSKIAIFGVAIAAFALLGSGCSGAAPGAPSTPPSTTAGSGVDAKCDGTDGLAKVRKQGFISVASGTNMPQASRGDNGEWIGFDADIIREIAKRLGVEAKADFPDASGMVAGVQGGRFDMTTGLYQNAEREKALSFTTPYKWTPDKIVVRSDNDSIKSVEDLKGKTATYPIGNTGELISKNLMEKGLLADTQVTQKWADSFKLLATGRADVIFYQGAYLDWLQKQTATNDFKAVETVDPALYDAKEIPASRFTMAKTSCGIALRDAVDPIVKEMGSDGTFAKLFAKYGITDEVWVDPNER